MFKSFVAALKGAGAFRFYCQPVMALVRGVRHGRKDSSENLAPLLRRLRHGSNKVLLLKQASEGIMPVVILALVLDVYAQ